MRPYVIAQDLYATFRQTWYKALVPERENTARWIGGPCLLCARHAVHFGGESPLRAVMTGTASLSKGVHREVESEGSLWQNLDSTNRNGIEGRRSGVTRQWTGRPNSYSDRCAGKSGGDRGKDARLTLGGLWGCLEDPTTALATVGEGPGEVSRGHSSPGRSG